MIFYIKKLTPQDGWETTSLVVCTDKEPENVEEYQVVEVDSIRDLI